LAFALILNVNASSAATVNGTSSLNSSVKTDLSSSMASVSATASKSSTTLSSKVTTYAKTVSDKTKPKIVKSDPVKKATNVNINRNIKITFSEKIKFGNKYIKLKNSKGSTIPITMGIVGNILVINPINNLTKGMKYTVYLHSGSIKDLNGNGISLQGLGFTTQSVKKPLPSALSQYLKPTKNCQSTNSKIKSLAASITKGKTSELSKASAIFNWVRNNISYSFYYNTRKGALGTLSSRSANCADTAHIMVALERAAGIPARYNHGTCRFSSGHYYGHVWAQVYVNGKWYYADGTSSRNSFGVVKNWNTNNFTLHGIYASLPF
jgi:transglutaminase-like putative cysteine protease